MAADDAPFEFLPENTVENLHSATWKILSVEDDAGYQDSLVFALESMRVQGKPIELLTARSATEAAGMIAANPDICVILLDVVMEDDQAGLRLVSTIREVIGNAAVRIILLTGQPGMAPLDDVMKRYDIDDYWSKTDLTDDRLKTIITTNVRTWDHMTQLIRARQGLQMVIEASQTISTQRDLQKFTRAVLEEIGTVLGIETGGIVCMLKAGSSTIEDAEIIAATGAFCALVGKTAVALSPTALLEAFREASRTGENVFRDGYTVFRFTADGIEDREYLTLVQMQRQLDETEVHLLRVFSENVRTGFTNVALYNRLTELAYSDALLGLHNRNWVLRQLDRLNDREYRHSRLIVLDIDDFTAIGITFGETFCNHLLQGLHARLAETFSGHALISRIDRDAFALLTGDEIPLDATRFEALLSRPLRIDDGEHRMTATVAELELWQVAELTPDQILRLAESTVETARVNHVPFMRYDPELEVAIANRYSLLTELRSAVSRELLSIDLQPKVRLSDGKLLGFEALARWVHPSGVKIPPDRFIPLAETSGLIGRLDLMILRKVCQAIKALADAGIQVPVAFNASSTDLLQPEFFGNLQRELASCGIEPTQLELEITESRAMLDYARIAPFLRRLIELGMGISIDDFGTGYSSLAHITDLAATTLKIDRTFVSRLGKSEDDELVVEMILRLGDHFGLDVVAEGVETELQRLTLMKRGCDAGQGYLFARPLPVQEAIDWARGRPG